MSDTHLSKSYSNFVVTLLLLFPILINSVKILGNLILLILVLLGTYIVINEKKNPFKIQELKVFSWLTFGYFCVMLLSILISDGFDSKYHHLGRKAHFLLAPLVALAIYRVNFPIERLLVSIKTGLIVIGIITITQYFLGDLRPSGMINANIFGDIAVIMLFLSVVQVFNEKPKEQIITFISTILGVAAIFLSGSRGSWLSFIILSIIYIILVYKPFLKENKKRKLFLLLFFLALFSIILIQPSTSAKITQAVTNIQNWSNGSEVFTSSGARMEMWRSGLMSSKESLWFGYGYRNANNVASNYALNYQEMIRAFTHLHNEYITTLVSAGVIGVLFLLLLLFTPLIIFIKNININNIYASMGILLCIGYATFGFTHIAFGEEHINAFYILFLAILLTGVQKKSKI